MSKKQSSSDDASFAELMNELEEVVTWFESETANIEDSLDKFERGMTVAGELKERLKVIENRVQKLQTQFEDV